MKNSVIILCLIAVFKCLTGHHLYSDCVSSQEIYILVHLFSSSARGCTEILPVPRQTTARLETLIHLSKHERRFDMQARAMSLVDIARPLPVLLVPVWRQTSYYTQRNTTVST